MSRKVLNHRMLLALSLAGSMLNLPARSQSAAAPDASSTTARTTQVSLPLSSPSTASHWHSRAGRYYERKWGVDIVDVRRVASGEMLAFRYVILDPDKAKSLNDKQKSAYLIDEKTGEKLTVPVMEKVGALRTINTPQAGKMYWVVFANTGDKVKDGSKVDVVIGDLRVDGMTVATK